MFGTGLSPVADPHPTVTGSQVSTVRDRASESAPPADGDAVLAALGDADCRSILGALDGTPRSVAELAAACELPLSTAYRKVDRLEAAGLLAERTRVDPDRNHESVYIAAAADVCVSVGGDAGLDVRVVEREGSERSAVSVPD